MSNAGTNPKDFGNIVTELSVCIENVVESLYKYQATDRNADLKDLRSTLQQQWKHIIQYLRACQAFRADIELLKEVIEGDKGDRGQFLNEIVEGTKKLKDGSETLKKRSCQVQQEFERKTSGGKNSEANDALSKIQSKLELVEKFWTLKEEEVRKPIDDISTQGNISKIIDEWKGWHTFIQDAILAIARATDAIPVIPPQLPPNYHPYFKRLFDLWR